MANLITLARVLLVATVVVNLYSTPASWHLVNPVLILLAFGGDALDGFVARRRGEADLFGAVADVAADRLIENVLWVCLSHLGLVSVWAALVFIVRGTIVDQLRSVSAREGRPPLATHTDVAYWLVASAVARIAYAVLKAITFGWLLFLEPWQKLNPSTWACHGDSARAVGDALVLATLVICLLRAVPVAMEFLMDPKTKAPS